MKRAEYIKRLEKLYDIAVKEKDIYAALAVLKIIREIKLEK